jgi:hypothetical protein
MRYTGMKNQTVEMELEREKSDYMDGQRSMAKCKPFFADLVACLPSEDLS